MGKDQESSCPQRASILVGLCNKSYQRGDDVCVLFSSLYKLHQAMRGIICLPFQPAIALQLDREQLPVKCDPLNASPPDPGPEGAQGRLPAGRAQDRPVSLWVACKGWVSRLFE